MIDAADRPLFTDDHHAFRDTVRRVLSDVIEPRLDDHERDGIVEREAWQQVGAAGLLCPQVPEAYGGPGLDFSFNAIVGEELSYMGSAAGFTLQSDIVADYIVHYGGEDQKKRYLPGMVAGTTISAIAMTEPGAGSDLQGIRTIAKPDGNGWKLSGSKTYITNGQAADLVIVAARTTEEGGARGLSLFLVEQGDEGFSRGRNLDKIGLHGNDTSELFFDEVKLPPDRLLGAENGGFPMLMQQLPQERLSIAVQSQASAQRAFDEAVKFTSDRKAFGKRVVEFQNTRFTLADLKAKWEHRKSINVAASGDRLSQRGSFRISPGELADLNLPDPTHFAVKANTLVAADTCGFHARATSDRLTVRVELWAYARRSPFIPWIGFDLLSWKPIAIRRAEWLASIIDWLARRGLKVQHWKPAGMRRPIDP